MAGLRALAAASREAAREAAVARAVEAEIARGEAAAARAEVRRHVPVPAAPSPERAAELAETRKDPTVQMLLGMFPGAEIGVMRKLTPEEIAARDAEAAFRLTPEGIAATEREREESLRRDRAAAAWAEWDRSPWAFASRRRNRDLMKETYSAKMPPDDILTLSEHLIPNGWSWVFQSVGQSGEKRTPIGGYPKTGLGKKGRKGEERNPFRPHPMAHDDMTPSTRALTCTTPEQRIRWELSIRRSHRKGKANVAIVTGPAAMVIVVDNDCSNAERAAVADRIAEETLGVTPYVRSRPGVPRNGRIYRATAEVFEVMRKTEVHWQKDDPDQKSRDAVELLIKGACFTVHGRHHSSGSVFEWAGPLPGMDPGATPDLAPEVTVDQLRAYLARLRVECPGEVVPAKEVKAKGDGDGTVHEVVDTGDMYVPRTRFEDGALLEGKKLKARRRDHVWAVVKDVVSVNAHVSRALQDTADGSDAYESAIKRLSAVVMTVVRRDIHPGDGFDDAGVQDELRGQLVRAATNYRSEDVRTGRAWARVFRRGEPVVDARPQHHAVLATAQTIAGVDSIRALMADVAATKLAMKLTEGEGPDARALLDADGMAAQAIRVAEEVRRPIMKWLDAVWDRAQGVRRVKRKEMLALERAASEVILLRAPTGAGKTQTLLTCVNDQIILRGRIGPILFMAPSYGLLSDVVGRIDGIVAEAEKAATDDAMKAAAALGLRSMVYQGKNRLCTRPEGALLTENGVSLRNLCDGEVSEWDPEAREWSSRKVSCHLKAKCRAWTQIREIADCDVVFLPTAYVSLPCPAELKACHALVVDEAVANRFLRADTLAIETLSLARREPFVSKAEQAEGTTSDDLMLDRREVAEIVSDWARRNVGKAAPEDVGVLLLDLLPLHDTPAAKRDRFSIMRVRSARNCLGRGASTFRSLNPETQAHEIAELLKGPVGTEVWPEWHLYGVLADRMEALAKDRLNAALVAEARANGHEPVVPARVARGAWDHRIQVTSGSATEGKSGIRIRVSWRAKNSFADLPTMLMDASASEKMIRKLWHGREVRTVTVAARMHMRVVAALDLRCSDSSMQPWRPEAAYERQEAATMACRVREVVDAVSALHGHSQVFVASTKSVEVALNTCWRAWDNVSWLHFGACVGLDFAKLFPACVIVGRQELPAGAVDSQVGALTYDDPEPELPLDLHGTGLDADGKGLKPRSVKRALKLRSGKDVILAVPVHAGEWAAAVQAQAREEQLLQALGRLRPVYRDGEAPVAVVLGNVLPEDLIVDAVCRMDELDVGLGKALRAGFGLRAAPPEVPVWRTGDPAKDAVLERAAALTARRVQGLVRFAYKRADGTEQLVDVVAPEVSRVADLVDRHEDAWGHGTPTALREVSRGAPLDGLKPREPDAKMVDLIGTADDQRAAERDSVERARTGDDTTQVGRDGKAVTIGEGDAARPVLLGVRVAATLSALATRPVGRVNLPMGTVAVPEQQVEPVEVAAPMVDVTEGIDPWSFMACA